jgi:hypothetical protein
MVERSRRKREMNDIHTTRMFLTTAVLAAVAALIAGPAQAMFPDGDGTVVTSTAPTQAKPGDPGTIPYLSHGIGVDESLFSGQQPSVGLTGDSPLTRGAMPASSNTQAVSSGDDFEWTWVGVGGGLAVLLAAALGGFYLSARHRGRIALP